MLTRGLVFKAKGSFKGDDLRRRREEQQVEIRRQKREENISKRRNFVPSAGPDSDDEVGLSNWDHPVSIPGGTSIPFTYHLLACSADGR